jgi:hypothetical protein
MRMLVFGNSDTRGTVVTHSSATFPVPASKLEKRG